MNARIHFQRRCLAASRPDVGDAGRGRWYRIEYTFGRFDKSNNSLEGRLEDVDTKAHLRRIFHALFFCFFFGRGYFIYLPVNITI